MKPLDDYEIEYHLTPDGWRRGSEWFFGRLQAGIQVPDNRVLTLRRRVYQSSDAAEKEISWRTIWRNPGISEADLDELSARFAPPGKP